MISSHRNANTRNDNTRDAKARCKICVIFESFECDSGRTSINRFFTLDGDLLELAREVCRIMTCNYRTNSSSCLQNHFCIISPRPADLYMKVYRLKLIRVFFNCVYTLYYLSRTGRLTLEALMYSIAQIKYVTESTVRLS